ncbi:hypothetical protein IQ06DRAFT_288821, partial [Phaeosphaeriaceae sp. SRC1lsM3a]
MVNVLSIYCLVLSSTQLPHQARLLHTGPNERTIPHTYDRLTNAIIKPCLQLFFNLNYPQLVTISIRGLPNIAACLAGQRMCHANYHTSTVVPARNVREDVIWYSWNCGALHLLWEAWTSSFVQLEYFDYLDL